MGAVRKATIKDLTVIVPLLRDLHGESVLRTAEINERKLRSFITHCLQTPTRVCLVYESTALTIEGLLIGYTADRFFSKERGAWDLVFYVRPEKRGTLVAYRRWSAFKSWATGSGASILWLGTAAGVDARLSRKFYLGLGMKEIGGIFRVNSQANG